MATAAMAMLTSCCPEKFEVLWWKAVGKGVFWREDITCSEQKWPPHAAHKDFPWSICPWMRSYELFVPLKAKQIFLGQHGSMLHTILDFWMLSSL